MHHAPYHMAPKKYKKMYNPQDMWLPPNVPQKESGKYKSSVRKNMAGYYANIAVLDDMVGNVIKTLKKEGIWNNTIILFTSDHGDLLGSHGLYGKQAPYDESIRVPMLFHYSGKQGINDGTYQAMISSQDLMPTLLGLAGIKIPKSVEGKDFSGYLHGRKSPKDTVALIESIHPFSSWRRNGGRAYRGVRTPRYTYIRGLKGPWLLFDNKEDPYQMDNLIENPVYNNLQAKLDKLLQQKLKENGDHFRPGSYYVKKFGYPKLNSSGAVPYMRCAGK
jgi:arylsulfatase A-like enzyme